MSDGLQAALNRANSRASILTSLSQTYGSGTNLASKPGIDLAVPIDTIPKNSKSISFLSLIDTIVGDGDGKFGKSIGDSISTKSIVLENDLKPVKPNAKQRRQLKKEFCGAASNTALKKAGLLKPLQVHHTKMELDALHKIWFSYIGVLILDCRGEAQLQARLCSAELVGAWASVVTSTVCGDTNTAGYIVSQSTNCYYIAVPRVHRRRSIPIKLTATEETTEPLTTITHDITEDIVYKTRRVVKDTCVLAITLPEVRNKAKRPDTAVLGAGVNAVPGTANNICVIYGKHHMPNCKYPAVKS